MQIVRAIALLFATLSTMLLIDGGPVGMENFHVPTNLGFLLLGVPVDTIRNIRKYW